MTHLSFTTSRDVLEALINCMQSPGALSDSGTHSSANAVFTFSMESGTRLNAAIGKEILEVRMHSHFSQMPFYFLQIRRV